MTNDTATWGFDIEEIETKEGRDNPPAGEYTFEITGIKDGGVCTDTKRQPYLMPELTILQAEDEEWEGRIYKHYMSLSRNNDRISYTKTDLQRMGCPLTNDGSPEDIIGAVFTADVKINHYNGNEYVNLRNIEAVAAEEEAPAEEPKTKAKPKPARRGTARGGSRR